MLSGLVQNLTVYEQRDYRRFLSPHLQYLQGLCQLSQQSISHAINELLTSLFVTVQLLPEIEFSNRINISIEQSKSNAPVLFTRLLSVVESTFHGNAFISSYGTNFKYSGPCQDFTTNYAPAKAVIYDNGCSCGMYANCTTQAKFIETSSLTNVSVKVKGMKMGCIPSESLLASTLECFYDQSCLDLIQQYTNYSKSLHPISTNFSRFLQNTTVNELINNLFIEDWSTTISYSAYYEQCSPSICSYSRVENFNIFYLITILLGIQGGLTIVLKWICPKLVRIAIKIYHDRKNRVTPFRPVDSGAISSNLTTGNYEIQPIISTSHSQPFMKIISIMSVVCISVGIIIFSIYYSRQGRNKLTKYEKL